MFTVTATVKGSLKETADSIAELVARVLMKGFWLSGILAFILTIVASIIWYEAIWNTHWQLLILLASTFFLFSIFSLICLMKLKIVFEPKINSNKN